MISDEAAEMRAVEDPTLRAFLLGDPTACRKVERWAWDIIRFKGFGIPREEQENLLQDTLVGVWQQVSKPGFVLRKRLGPLVRTIAIRRCLDYFKSRTTQAPRDAAFGLSFVTAEAKSEEDQKRCVAALERKCEILWELLDAVENANRKPALSPHVSLRPDGEEVGKWVAVLPERALRVASRPQHGENGVAFRRTGPLQRCHGVTQAATDAIP